MKSIVKLSMIGLGIYLVPGVVQTSILLYGGYQLVKDISLSDLKRNICIIGDLVNEIIIED